MTIKVGSLVKYKPECNMPDTGTKKIFIVRHIGTIDEEQRIPYNDTSDTIWSTWEKPWNGKIASISSGGDLTYMDRSDLIEVNEDWDS